MPDSSPPFFFAYGLFRPGQLGWLRIREHVESYEPGTVRGELLVRDGLAILDPEGTADVSGFVMHFARSDSEAAYQAIDDLEPNKHYWWGVTQVMSDSGPLQARILNGRSPKKGSSPLAGEWDGRQDPLFRQGLQTVKELQQEAGARSAEDVTGVLRLQAAYLLLWTIIERYVTFRYGLRGSITERIHAMAEEPALRRSLQEHVSRNDTVYKTDKPGDDSATLDKNNQKGSLNYYYYVRNNISHRGKLAVDRFRLDDSLTELRKIFQDVLDAAFDEAASK